MKKIALLLCVSIALVSIACSDDNENATPAASTSTLVGITSSASYSPADLATAVAQKGEQSSLSSQLASYIAKNYVSSQYYHIDTLVARRSNANILNYRRNWQITTQTFAYQTLSATGQPVVMHGRVTYPSMITGTPHELTTLTIHAGAATDSADLPSQSLNAYALRSVLNSAVIQPDLHGYATTPDKSYSGLAARSTGRQVIDCTLAALEVMQQRGVTPSPSCFATGWGLGAGETAIINAAYYYDNLMPSSIKQLINLRQIYASSGLVSLYQTLRHFNLDTSYDASLLRHLLPMLYTLPQEMLGGYSVEDFAPEWMNYYIIDIDGQPCTYLYALQHGIAPYEQWPDQYSSSTLKNHFASDMLHDNGHLKYQNPKTQTLLSIANKLSQYGDWTPSMHIYMLHSTKDKTTPYEQARTFYDDRSSASTMHWKNLNRTIIGFTLPNATAEIITFGYGLLYCQTPRQAFNSTN